MATGQYIVFQPEDAEWEIEFELVPNAQEDIAQEDLLFEIESVLDTLKALYLGRNLDLLKSYFDQLLKLAQVGLVGDNAQPKLAKRSLEHLKKEITDRESGKVKNKYLTHLGKKALVFGLPALLFGMLMGYFQSRGLANSECLYCTYFANLALLWAGTMVGVWLSFAITRTYIGFEDLVIIEKDRLEPSLRLVFTGTLALIFGLLFIQEAIVITLGSLSSTEIASDPISAFVLGAILGVNEKIIGNTLTKKTAALFEGNS